MIKPYYEEERITIYHGNCMNIIKEISNNYIDFIINDPPYGIDYQSSRRTDKSKRFSKIKNDKVSFTRWFTDSYRILKIEKGLICFYRWDVWENFKKEIDKTKFNIKSQIIWDKIIHGMGDLNGAFSPQHENIIFVTKGKFKFPNKRPKYILRFKRVNPEKMLHPNEKPILLIKEIISKLTIENDLILDCFLGSGTTLVAAKELNRRAIGIEIEEKYCEIAAKRLQGWSKKQMESGSKTIVKSLSLL